MLAYVTTFPLIWITPWQSQAGHVEQKTPPPSVEEELTLEV